jgi:hypothetical protein
VIAPGEFSPIYPFFKMRHGILAQRGCDRSGFNQDDFDLRVCQFEPKDIHLAPQSRVGRHMVPRHLKPTKPGLMNGSQSARVLVRLTGITSRVSSCQPKVGLRCRATRVGKSSTAPGGVLSAIIVKRVSVPPVASSVSARPFTTNSHPVCVDERAFKPFSLQSHAVLVLAATGRASLRRRATVCRVIAYACG